MRQVRRVRIHLTNKPIDDEDDEEAGKYRLYEMNGTVFCGPLVDHEHPQ